MAELCYIDWHVTPFRADRFLDMWEPAASRVLAFGAQSWTLSRDTQDPLLIRQTSLWEHRADFDRYWYSDEIVALKERTVDLYSMPITARWHTVLAAE